MKKRILIGNSEASSINKRLVELGMTKVTLSNLSNIEYRNLQKILSINKNKKISVERNKINKIIEILGVGYSYVFPEIPSEYKSESFFSDIFKKWVEKKIPRVSRDNVEKDKSISNSYGFANTAIIGEISKTYPSVRDFFENRTSFSIIPDCLYWRMFSTKSVDGKNYYIYFEIIPKNKNKKSTFYISYTLKTNLNIGEFFPRKVRIIYAKIVCDEDYNYVYQYYNNPSLYRIKKSNNIGVVTWVDKMDHDFIIHSDDDFSINIDKKKNKKIKPEVKHLSHLMETAILQKNSFFHRDKLGDISDDVSFFWSNEVFLDLNPEIKDKI